ncbi:hypothetical protein HDU93_009214 [Gonapodya sp. JEL0774]|nr:hypothetical protein HDU93_009214 [Gonapodya sp. JEL0774]
MPAPSTPIPSPSNSVLSELLARAVSPLRTDETVPKHLQTVVSHLNSDETVVSHLNSDEAVASHLNFDETVASRFNSDQTAASIRIENYPALPSLTPTLEKLVYIPRTMIVHRLIPSSSSWLALLTCTSRHNLLAAHCHLILLLPTAYHLAIPSTILSAASNPFTRFPMEQTQLLVASLFRQLLPRNQAPSALPLAIAVLKALPTPPTSEVLLTYPLLSLCNIGDTSQILSLLYPLSVSYETVTARKLYSLALHQLYMRGYFLPVRLVWAEMLRRNVKPQLLACRTMLACKADGAIRGQDVTEVMRIWGKAREVAMEEEGTKSIDKKDGAPLILSHCFTHTLRFLLRAGHTIIAHSWLDRALSYYARYAKSSGANYDGICLDARTASVITADAANRNDPVGCEGWMRKFKSAGAPLSAHSVSSLVSTLCHASPPDPVKAEEVLRDCEQEWGVTPVGESFHPLLMYYDNLGDDAAVARVEDMMRQAGVRPSVSMYSMRVARHLRNGRRDLAAMELTDMKKVGLTPTTKAIISIARHGVAKMGNVAAMQGLKDEMNLSNVPWDHSMLALEISTWLNKAKQGARKGDVESGVKGVVEEARRRGAVIDHNMWCDIIAAVGTESTVLERLREPGNGRQRTKYHGGTPRVIEDDPSTPRALVAYMSHHISHKRPELAVSAFWKYHTPRGSSPPPPRAWNWLLRAYAMLGYDTEIRKTWVRMDFAGVPKDAIAWTVWAGERIRRGKMSEAEAALKEVVKASIADSKLPYPTYAASAYVHMQLRLHRDLALGYISKNRLRRSVEHLQSALKLDVNGNSSETATLAGAVLSRIKDSTGLDSWSRLNTIVGGKVSLIHAVEGKDS